MLELYIIFKGGHIMDNIARTLKRYYGRPIDSEFAMETIYNFDVKKLRKTPYNADYSKAVDTEFASEILPSSNMKSGKISLPTSEHNTDASMEIDLAIINGSGAQS
jgi:hypothetical protein